MESLLLCREKRGAEMIAGVELWCHSRRVAAC